MIISMRVLIVEDDQNLAETIKSGLEESGYAVDWVSDGFSGLDMVSTYAYDVIILDIMLPGMDGFTICQQIRSKHIESPILILTASTGKAIKSEVWIAARMTTW